MLRRLRPYSAILWTALILLICELGLEVRAASRGYGAYLLGRLPGVQGSTDPDPGAIQFGPTPDFPYRSQVIAPEDARRQTTLWLSSSSYGEDVHVTVEQLFATRISNNLGLPLINASRGGNTIINNVEHLNAGATDFEPDIVLLYQMSNDIDQISERMSAGQNAAEGPQPASADSAASTSFAPISPMVQQMTIYQQLKRQITPRLSGHLPLWDTLDGHEAAGTPAAQDVFRQRVESLIQTAKDNNAQPVLVTFPTAYTIDNIDQFPGWLARQNLAVNTVLSARGWTQTIADYNALLLDIAATENVACIDLASLFANRPKLFRDLWHLKPKGHEIVGDLLADELRKLFPELNK